MSISLQWATCYLTTLSKVDCFRSNPFHAATLSTRRVLLCVSDFISWNIFRPVIFGFRRLFRAPQELFFLFLLLFLAHLGLSRGLQDLFRAPQDLYSCILLSAPWSIVRARASFEACLYNCEGLSSGPTLWGHSLTNWVCHHCPIAHVHFRQQRCTLIFQAALKVS